MGRLLIGTLLLVYLSGCAVQTESTLVYDQCVYHDEKLVKKAAALFDHVPAQSELCKAISLLEHADISSQDKAVAFSNAGVQPDERFFSAQSLISDRHQAEEQGFASLLVAYLTEDGFQCRHPIYASYFSKRFKGQFDYQNCSSSVPFYLFDTHVGGRLVEVNPRNVREIHLVFTSEGEGVASSFGHVSVRLLVCPSTNSSIEACHQNLFNHVFLGYVARIDGLRMSVLKGLVGGYDAHLFGSTFREVFRSNTVLADRDIYSLPLKLNDFEIEQIVRDLSEVHWAYRGNYRFITANCATLLQDLLNQALGLPEKPNSELNYLRPDSLFESLKRSSLARGDVFKSLELAERQGYFFPRNRIYYQQALDYLQESIEAYPFGSLDEYVKVSAPIRLMTILSQEKIYQTLKLNERLLEAQRLLEERWLMMLWFESFHLVAEIIIEFDLIQVLSVKVEQMIEGPDKQLLLQCYVQPLQQISSEVTRFQGIPAESQLQKLVFDNHANCQTVVAQQRVYELMESALSQENDSMKSLAMLERELVQTMDNIDTLERLF